MHRGREHPVLSVVAPAHNEQENVAELVEQVGRACESMGVPFEFVIVDDGSTDNTRKAVRDLMATRPWLRCVGMKGTPPGRGNGQSAAFHAGFRAARGDLIAVLDADLQNDPADLPAMYRLLQETGADVVQGDRSHARRDNVVRRVGSVVGRKFRLWFIKDSIRDTGCSLRLMKREVAMQLPLWLHGMHRFIPGMARRRGYKVVEMRVSHRPRLAGTPKYGLGITKRAVPGFIDLMVVRYMHSRWRCVECEEVLVVHTRSAWEPSPDLTEPGPAVVH